MDREITRSPDRQLATPHSRGAILAIRAIPRAGRNGIAGTRGDALLVRIAAAPVDGAANDELIAILARTLGIRKRQISVIAGERARDKRVLMEGISPQSLESRLSAILDQIR